MLNLHPSSGPKKTSLMNFPASIRRQLNLLPVRITLIFAAIFLGAAVYQYIMIFSFFEEDLDRIASQGAMLRLERATQRLANPTIPPERAADFSIPEAERQLHSYAQQLFLQLPGDDVAIYTLQGTYVTGTAPKNFPQVLHVDPSTSVVTAVTQDAAHRHPHSLYALLPLMADSAMGRDASGTSQNYQWQIGWQVIYIDTSAQQQLQEKFIVRISIGFLVTAVLILAGGTYLRSYTQRSLQPLLQLTQEIGQGKWHEPFHARLTGEFQALGRRILEMRANLARYQQQRQTIVDRISHDIVGPLKTIMLVASANQVASAEHAETSAPHATTADQPQPGNDWQLVHSCAEHVNRLLDDLYYLISSKIEYGGGWQIPNLDLAPVLHDTLVYYQSRYRNQRIEFKAHNSPEFAAYPVQIERTRFLQIIGNLAENAIVHGRASHITFALSMEQEEWVRLDVIDNGKGMSEQILSHIFTERFTVPNSVRADPATMSNQGLGLAIVADIVQAHSGTITVSSTVGQGTAFMILLPRAGTTDERACDCSADATGQQNSGTADATTKAFTHTPRA